MRRWYRPEADINVSSKAGMIEGLGCTYLIAKLIPKFELLKPHTRDINPKVLPWLILLYANAVFLAQFIFVDQGARPIEIRILGNGIARVRLFEIKVYRVHEQRRLPRHVDFVQPHQLGHLCFTVLFGKLECLGQVFPHGFDYALRGGDPDVR